MVAAVHYEIRPTPAGLLVAHEVVHSSEPWAPLPQPKPEPDPIGDHFRETMAAVFGLGREPSSETPAPVVAHFPVQSRPLKRSCVNCWQPIADHCDNCQIPCCPGKCPHDIADPPTRVRRVAEDAAASTYQGEWSERVYESVTGLRWRCCGNLFTEDHTPWCPA